MTLSANAALFLTLDALMDRGLVLDKKLMPVRLTLRDISQAQAQEWYDTYLTWYNDVLLRIDADLQQRRHKAHLGSHDEPGTQHLFDLILKACDPDTVTAEPARKALHSHNWHHPLDLLDTHLETLETARRRAFPATGVLPQDLKSVIADSQWRYSNFRIDDLFINSGCEPHWWVRPLARHDRKSTRRVQGWFTAVQIYAPQREVAIVQQVCREVLRNPRLTEQQRATILAFLSQFQTQALHHQPPTVHLPQSSHAASSISCFISYASRDQAIAERLYADLQARGVACWYAPHDMEIGTPIVDGLDEAIRRHDAVLLILSQSSVLSGWVEYEATLALTRELEEHRTLLFPIRIDDSVMQITSGWAAKLRGRHIGDFRDWKQYDAYLDVLQRLLRDLQRAKHRHTER